MLKNRNKKLLYPQLTLLDFGVKTFLSADIKKEELAKFADKVSEKENIISVLRQKEIEFQGDYPLNVQRIIELTNDDSAFIKLVLQSFIADVPGYFSELETYMESQDKTRVLQIAHKVKSPLNIVGVKNFMHFAETLEKEMESEATDWGLSIKSVNDLTTKFKEAQKAVLEVLEERLPS